MPERRKLPSRPRLGLAALAAALLLGVVALVPRAPGEDRPGPVEVTITAAEARPVLDAFIDLLNRGDADAAFTLLGEELRSNPEGLHGLPANAMLDFDQELQYARWTAALGGRRSIGSCTAEPWTHLVNGSRRGENAQLLTCRGTYTSDFLLVLGEPPMRWTATAAVAADHQIDLYQESLTEFDNAAVYLAFRRWLRDHHPDEELRVFTPGGSPLATAESAQLMLLRAPEFAADRGTQSERPPQRIGGR